MHYVESCKLWSLPSLGVYYLSCIHDVKYNNSLTKMKEWWNKVLTDSWSNVKFFLLFTSIHKTNWEENLAIYQNHLGKVYVEARMLRNWTLKGLHCPGRLIHFVYNANYTSLFTMELEKFLMNDKSIASCLPRIKTKVTNNKNKLWKLKPEIPQLQSVSIFFQLNAPFCVSCVIYVTGQNHIQVWVF